MNNQQTPAEKLAAGLYEEALADAKLLLKSTGSDLERGQAYYVIGCVLNEFGDRLGALENLLEAVTLFPTSQPLLVAHAQDELARLQHANGFMSSALFFTEMAITNFELGGNTVMKESSEKLREEILWKS